MLLIAITTVKCQKEQSFDVPNVPPTTNAANPITAHLQGVVVDENGTPTSGALVMVGTKTATTGTNGFFRIKDAALDKSASVVKIEKAGYFVGYRTFMATEGSNHVKVKLVKKQLVGTVSATSGGVATLAIGASVTLQSNGIVKKAGGAYTGDVQVYAAYIDPAAADIAETIPGSFMADDKDNKRVLLKSFGMLAVELESTSGEKLQIATGKTAELKTPIPTTLLATSPSTIPLWYVDEVTGLWKEQGTATKVGNNYVGNVSHFSFWNCDVPMNAVTLSFRLVTSGGLPIVDAYVYLQSQFNGSAGGYTNFNGEVSGLVPANENLNLLIQINCNATSSTAQSLGSFNQNTNLGNIVSTTNIPIIVVSGNLVNCSGQPVSNGEVYVQGNGWPSYITANSSGNFGYAYLKCSTNPISMEIMGIDNTTQQQGPINSFTINNTNINIGTLVACGNSSSQFINYTLDGTNYSITNLVDSSKGYTFIFNNNPPIIYTSGLIFMDANSSKNIIINFNSPITSIGNYNINSLYSQNSYRTPLSSSTIKITNFPLVNNLEFYEGNFSASYNDAVTPSLVHSINGNFRIRKIY